MVSKEEETYLWFALKKYLTIIRNTRKNSLLKDHDVLLGETKVLVFLEELLCRPSRRSTGHDIPRHSNILLLVLLRGKLLHLPYPLSLDLKQWLRTWQADVEATLWSRTPKTCALPTSHKYDSNLVLRNKIQALFVPWVQVFLLGVQNRCHCGVRERL